MVPVGALCDDALVPGVTIIDVGVRVRGEVSGPGDVHIRGRVEGRIHVSGRVWVEEGGVAAADVVAARVRIDGRLEGRVRVSRQVSVGAQGHLVGDVWGTLAVDEGGTFEGRIVPDSDDRVTLRPASPAPRASLRLEPDGPGGALRLPTKRRITQPSAERVSGEFRPPHAASPPGFAESGGFGTLVGEWDDVSGADLASGSHPSVSGRFGASSGSHPSISGEAQPVRGPADPVGGSSTHRTPRRLVATPRTPAPLLDEPPPAAPSTARLPRITDADLQARSKGSVAPATAPSPPDPRPETAPGAGSAARSLARPSPSQPRMPARQIPPLRQDPTVEGAAHRPAESGRPAQAAPPGEDLADAWFEEEDFLVKGTEPLDAGPDPSPRRTGPSRRSAPDAPAKKKSKKPRGRRG